MFRSIFGVSMLLAAASFAPVAQAEILTFSFYGTILDGEDISGVFAAPGSDLTGMRIAETFTFDTTLGDRGPVVGEATDALFGGSNASPPTTSPALSATITINEKTVSIGGAFAGLLATNAGVSFSAADVQDEIDFADAFVFTPDAPTLVDTPFVPHGSGGGGFNLDEMDSAGVFQNANAEFAIPEPATWAMMVLGLGGVGAVARRRRIVLA